MTSGGIDHLKTVESQGPVTSGGDNQNPAPIVGGGGDHGTAATGLMTWGNGSAPSLPSEENIFDVDHDIVNDFDSAIGGLSEASSSTSLRSAIFEYVEENGRTYHRYKQGKYPLPNDEQEQDRLDLQHKLFEVTFSGNLYFAPLNNPLNVLDVATGTGIWAIEFAEKNPSATVIGTDLSPIQPLYVPPNCRFEVDDAEDEWTFNNFDYIHARTIMSCFTDPKSVFQQAFNALSPGGYFEVQDGEFPVKYVGPEPTESAFYKWTHIIVEGAAKSGRPWTNAPNYARWMREVGFEDVIEKKFYWPTSQWPKGKYLKEVAFYFQEDMLRALEGMSLKVMKHAGWSNEEIQAFLPDVRADIKNTSLHTYFDITVVYGRKPTIVV